MKKIILILILSLSFIVNAQRRDRDWQFSIGVNTVNSNGRWSPPNSPDSWAFKSPISWGLEKMLSETNNGKWTIEQSFSINEFTTENKIDGNFLDKNYTFFSTNTTAKFYLNDLLFNRRNRESFDLYAGAGVGIFIVNKLNFSGNIVGGANYWFSDNIGIGIKGMAKFAATNKNRYDTNHFQYYLELVIR